MALKLRCEVAGVFTISTDKRGVISEFPNLITDGGLNRMGANGDFMDWCQVGSGSATPLVTDSALANRVAGSNSVQSATSSVQSSAPYYAFRRITYRFAAGVAAGNLSEVGIGWTSTASLFSRALIVDSLGNPTAITIQPDETLDVTYELRYFVKTTDSTGQVTLTGNIGGTYDWIMRAANVTTAGGNGWALGVPGQRYTIFSADVYTGDIGSITSIPAGYFDNGPYAAQSYVEGSLEVKFNISYGLNDANNALGIRSIALRMGFGRFQYQFTPAIPKTANDTLSLVTSITWGRAA